MPVTTLEKGASRSSFFQSHVGPAILANEGSSQVTRSAVECHFCSQACLDDDVCISCDFVMGSQAQVDSYRLYSEAFNLFRAPNLHVDVCH